MSLTKEKKKELIVQYQKHKKDTGSPEVQITILTERINDLTNHLTSNPKDYQSQRGLLMSISKRRSLLDYLEETNKEVHRRVIDQLGIRN